MLLTERSIELAIIDSNRFGMANRVPTGFDSAVVTSSGHSPIAHCTAYNSSDHERKLRKMFNEMVFYFRTYVAEHLQLIPKK